MLGLNNQEIQNGNNIKGSQKKWGAFIDECLDKHFTITDFFSIVESINSEDRYKQHFGVIGLRKILSNEQGPPIQPVIDANLVPRLVSFLFREDEPRLQLEAAWAITNIASGTTQQIQSIVDSGAIPVLIKLLSCGKDDIIEQVIWALGNIAGDSTALRNIILNLGGLDPLISFIDRSNNEVLIKVGVWAISNLCRGRPLPDFESTKNAVPVLSKVVQQSDDTEVLTDATWALSYICSGPEETIEAVARTNIMPSLVKHFQTNYLALLIPVARIIGNLLTGNEAHTNLVIEHPEVADRFYDTLCHTKRALRREVCWAMSNLAAGPSYQADFIIRNSKLLTKLIELAKNDVMEIKREALWALRNLMNNASPDQMALLLETDMLQAFCNLLNYADDAKTIENALRGVDQFLSYGACLGFKEGETNAVQKLVEQYGAIESIEKLQSHPSEKVYKAALEILEKYFDNEDLIE